MSRALFQPLLQNLRHYPADGLLLLAAASSYCSDERPGQIHREYRFGVWHGPQLEMILSLLQIAI